MTSNGIGYHQSAAAQSQCCRGTVYCSHRNGPAPARAGVRPPRGRSRVLVLVLVLVLVRAACSGSALGRAARARAASDTQLLGSRRAVATASRRAAANHARRTRHSIAVYTTRIANGGDRRPREPTAHTDTPVHMVRCTARQTRRQVEGGRNGEGREVCERAHPSGTPVTLRAAHRPVIDTQKELVEANSCDDDLGCRLAEKNSCFHRLMMYFAASKSYELV